MGKLQLEPTAALVMEWAFKLYNEENTLRFINRMDLSSGNNLYQRCNSVCKWYEEIILNRKSFIKYLIERELSVAKHKYQLVILAAGKSPLTIEILSRHLAKVHGIFEIDISGMEEKKNLYLELFPEFQEKVQCINTNIASPDIRGIIGSLNIGYRHDLTTIVLLEGISYYLEKQELKDIIASFKKDNKCIFIIEYLVPFQYVSRSRRSIPKGVFSVIQEDCELESISSYTKEELEAFFCENGGHLLATYSMTDMEVARTGTKTRFQNTSDGWIECAIGTVGTSGTSQHIAEIAHDSTH
jgi:O-methyltransferase involved in polyketide biosynthesis